MDDLICLAYSYFRHIWYTTPQHLVMYFGFAFLAAVISSVQDWYTMYLTIKSLYGFPSHINELIYRAYQHQMDGRERVDLTALSIKYESICEV